MRRKVWVAVGACALLFDGACASRPERRPKSDASTKPNRSVYADTCARAVRAHPELAWVGVVRGKIGTRDCEEVARWWVARIGSTRARGFGPDSAQNMDLGDLWQFEVAEMQYVVAARRAVSELDRAKLRRECAGLLEPGGASRELRGEDLHELPPELARLRPFWIYVYGSTVDIVLTGSSRGPEIMVSVTLTEERLSDAGDGVRVTDKARSYPVEMSETRAQG